MVTLQALNRELPVLKHFRVSRSVHPERLYEEFLRIAGELARADLDTVTLRFDINN